MLFEQDAREAQRRLCERASLDQRDGRRRRHRAGLVAVAIAGDATERFEAGSVNLALQLGQVGQPVILSAPYVLKNYKPAGK